MITIIEPHADDAFLSLGSHIEAWRRLRQQVAIVTVFSGTRRRGDDAQRYARAVGAEWLGLGAREPDDGGRRGDGARALAGLPRGYRGASGVTVLVPLAIAHPEHVEVRRAAEDLGLCPWYYLDQPYAATQKHGEHTSLLLGGKVVCSFRPGSRRKYRHIPLFRDQGRFFHYNPVERLERLPELIVRNP